MVAIDPGDVDAEASDTQAFDLVLQQPIDPSQLSGLLHHLCFQRRRALSPK
ncbi:MAG TPA: hypothetical protein VMJ10_30060 [Kofleriaceae bacterium]|nr:hypothetical protein [Kofleriaceae bacterium]